MPIPEDVLETIINYLRDQKKVLCACALVSQMFCFISQRVLYSNIIFGDYEKGDSDPQLIDTLSHRPQFALHVRDLSIGMDSCIDLVDLPHIIRMFTNIRSLDVFGGQWARSWDQLSDEIRQAVGDLLLVPILTDITISYLQDFPCLTAFTRSPQLKTLSFVLMYPQEIDSNTNDDVVTYNMSYVTTDNRCDDTGVSINPGKVPVVDNQHAALDALTVIFESFEPTSEHILHNLSTPGTIPGLGSLRALHIACLGKKDDVCLVQKLLDAVGNSLQNLQLSVNLGCASEC
jgi:hypothetical protein